LDIYDETLRACTKKLSVNSHVVAAAIQIELESITDKVLEYDHPSEVTIIDCDIAGESTKLELSYAYYNNEIIVSKIEVID
jgi:hypothetical protein